MSSGQKSKKKSNTFWEVDAELSNGKVISPVVSIIHYNLQVLNENQAINHELVCGRKQGLTCNCHWTHYLQIMSFTPWGSIHFYFKLFIILSWIENNMWWKIGNWLFCCPRMMIVYGMSISNQYSVIHVVGTW